MTAAEYLSRVRELPCCACWKAQQVQSSPTQAHHVFHDRFGSERSSDWNAIPLCEGHHQGDFDNTKIAIHRAKDAWRRLFGPDHGFVAATQMRILGRVMDAPTGDAR